MGHKKARAIRFDFGVGYQAKMLTPYQFLIWSRFC